MELAAGVDKPFRVIIRREQEVTDEGIVVVQLRVARYDDPGFDRLLLLGRTGAEYQGSQGEEGKVSSHYSTVITVLR